MSPFHFSHSYAFDPGYNMDLAQLLAIDAPQPPADFADFWQRRHAAALALSPRPRIKLVGSPYPHHAVYELRYASTDAVEIGGWLLITNHGQVRRSVVFGHGYGGCELPQDLLPLENAVLL